MTICQLLRFHILRRLKINAEVEHYRANENEGQVIERDFLDFVLLLRVL